MRPAFHRLVYALLVALVVNAAGWTFNAEIFEEPNVGSHPLTLADLGNSTPDDPAKVVQDTCNHGCHAASHFLGQVSHALTIAAAAGTAPLVACIPHGLLAHTSCPQFRPPRSTFLA